MRRTARSSGVASAARFSSMAASSDRAMSRRLVAFWFLLSGTGLLACLSNIAFAYDIEPKRPLSAAQELKVAHIGGGVTVSGETFAYTFQSANGLVGSVKVAGAGAARGSHPGPHGGRAVRSGRLAVSGAP